MLISYWSSDVCSSDLLHGRRRRRRYRHGAAGISGLALGRAGRTRNADRSLQAPALSLTGRGIRPARLILQRKRGAEHIGEHRLRQPPRVRVVARAMIAIDEADRRSVV